MNWPLIQVNILELSCDCYWNLNMPREYLRKQFEILLMKKFDICLTEYQCDKMHKSANLLEDNLILDFSKFFTIENFIITESSLSANIFSNFVLVNINNILVEFFYF